MSRIYSDRLYWVDITSRSMRCALKIVIVHKLTAPIKYAHPFIGKIILIWSRNNFFLHVFMEFLRELGKTDCR